MSTGRWRVLGDTQEPWLSCCHNVPAPNTEIWGQIGRFRDKHIVLGTNTLLGASQHCWDGRNNVGSAGTLLGASQQCGERWHIVGSLATMCFGLETMLGASQHCFWSYHNVFGARTLFPGFRDQDSRSCAEAGLFSRLQRLSQWIGRSS